MASPLIESHAYSKKNPSKRWDVILIFCFLLWMSYIGLENKISPEAHDRFHGYCWSSGIGTRHFPVGWSPDRCALISFSFSLTNRELFGNGLSVHITGDSNATLIRNHSSRCTIMGSSWNRCYASGEILFSNLYTLLLAIRYLCNITFECFLYRRPVLIRSEHKVHA